jgi:hypothetical protein
MVDQHDNMSQLQAVRGMIASDASKDSTAFKATHAYWLVHAMGR